MQVGADTWQVPSPPTDWAVDSLKVSKYLEVFGGVRVQVELRQLFRGISNVSGLFLPGS